MDQYHKLDDKLRNYLNKEFEENRRNPLFHYTSHSGLQGILTSRKLWLTDHAYLNDPSEIEHCKAILLKYFADHLKNNHEFKEYFTSLLQYIIDNCYRTYITSFCSEGDYLPAWRYYGGNGAGYSIGFRKEYFAVPDQPVDPRESMQLFKVIYQESKAVGIIKKIVDLSKAIEPKWKDSKNRAKRRQFLVTFISYLISIIPAVKNNVYKDEKEWRWCMIRLYFENEWFPASLPMERLIFQKMDTQNLPPFIKHVHTVVPHLQSVEFEYSDINTIYVGPRLDFLNAKLFIEKLLLESGISPHVLSRIKIKKSEKPFK